VFFLGVFDCVNSVGTFEIPLHQKSYNVIASPPADYVRHAISIHERRLKFKPALFHIDEAAAKLYKCDVKEVWFAGNHGDVGGGWNLAPNQKKLLSDIPLQWMLDELDSLPEPHRLAWKNPRILSSVQDPSPQKGWFWQLFSSVPPSPREARIKTSRPHDMLAFGEGASIVGTIGWWVLEILPFFTRLELEDGKWVPRHFPPNLGAKRDIPLDAAIHHSVKAMSRAGIISEDQTPVLGGTELRHQFRVEPLVLAWAGMRKARFEKGKDKESEPAKCWDDSSKVAAQTWALM
jgi:hypothetical protein